MNVCPRVWGRLLCAAGLRPALSFGQWGPGPPIAGSATDLYRMWLITKKRRYPLYCAGWYCKLLIDRLHVEAGSTMSESEALPMNMYLTYKTWGWYHRCSYNRSSIGYWLITVTVNVNVHAKSVAPYMKLLSASGNFISLSQTTGFAAGSHCMGTNQPDPLFCLFHIQAGIATASKWWATDGLVKLFWGSQYSVPQYCQCR